MYRGQKEPSKFCAPGVVFLQQGFILHLYFFWYIMQRMNGKQVIVKLKEAGWALARIEGSHYIMQKTGVLRSVPVPVHGAKDLGAGLLAAIQRQSGVKLK